MTVRGWTLVGFDAQRLIGSAAVLAGTLTLGACVSEGPQLAKRTSVAPATADVASAAPSAAAGSAVAKTADADAPDSKSGVALASADAAKTAKAGTIATDKTSRVAAKADVAADTAAAVQVADATQAKPQIAAVTALQGEDGAAQRRLSVVQSARQAVALAAKDVPAVADASELPQAPVAIAVSDTTGSISGSATIDRLIESYAAENNIPSELAYAVVHTESRYNPNARGSGVYGLSQIKPSTARGLGFSGPASALLDPATNLKYGMKYLSGAWEKSGHDVCGTSMRYKAGHRATRMSRATLAYCSSVKSHMAEVRSRMPKTLKAGVVLAAAETGKLVRAVKPTLSTALQPIAAAAVLPGVSWGKGATKTEAAAAQPAEAARTVASAEAPKPTLAPRTSLFARAGSSAKGGRIAAASSLDAGRFDTSAPAASETAAIDGSSGIGFR
ncbi:lytic transglycosylase domain-containing protein [Mangrovicella endophytica]|uniref:lytic transglycosylase domain-containing protein n=1 Tax=Mangrovicella endophytica TaxID=2066697 RepID=UPI0013001333|nr:transglycosylase SLT domain-containing protein [Mangrovicella endophytica]